MQTVDTTIRQAGGKPPRNLPWLLLSPAAGTLVACGGGGSGSTPTAQILGASPAGIWRGTDSTTGLEVVGLIDELGEAEFLRADRALFQRRALNRRGQHDIGRRPSVCNQ
jgi:hypothetical protein